MQICLATLHCKPAFIPLALLYLKAYLVEQKGHPFDAIDIVEFTQQSTHDQMLQQILNKNPDVVALSCYVWNIKKLMAVCRAIKQCRPDIRIVLGGPEVGPVARSVLGAHADIDVVVKSEGEIPFSAIVDAWNDGGDIRSVRGICFRNSGGIVDNEDAPILQDLNHLSSPHLPAYANHKGRVVCIETQRGCVFRCNFCFYNKDLSVRNRRFDLDRVKQEIFFWLQHDVAEIYLMDPVFNLYAERAKDICRFVVEHNCRRIPFHAEVWAEFIDEELARLMHEGNFRFIEVGLQTTDETALATVERRLKMQKFLAGIGYLKQFNLNFELQLIYGLPGETLASFKKSLDFAASLDPPDLAVFPLMVLPGTELWRKADGLHLEFDPEPPYLVRSHFSMGPADIEYGAKVVRALEYLGKSKAIRLLCREPGVTFAGIVDDWIAWEPGQPARDSRNDQVQRFLSRFCERRQIPPDFYRAFASLELQ